MDNALKNPLVTAVLAVKSGNDIVAASEDNPIPFVASKGSSAPSLAVEDETTYIASGFTVAAAGTGNYNQFQIWNPVGSGKKVVIYGVVMWQTGSVTINGIESSSALSATEANRVLKNTTIGSSKIPSTKVYTSSTATLPTADPNWEVLVNTQNPAGSSVVPSSVPFTLLEGRGMIFIQRTTNIALNATVVIGEVPI